MYYDIFLASANILMSYMKILINGIFLFGGDFYDGDTFCKMGRWKKTITR